jgi:2-hydroxy-3-keto-5-methylthiopentenyl-1-phosphate phosphatase
VDSLHLVLLEFGDVGVYEAAEDSLGRELTLHEVIALEFETVRAPLGEVVEWVRENVRVRPGFTEIVELHRPFVVSSGFGQPCKRADVAGLGEFAYVGDGFSDRCVALAAERVFARDGLAAYLRREGVPFEPFDDFHDVARAL